jgi:hypothetical protein
MVKVAVVEAMASFAMNRTTTTLPALSYVLNTIV